MRIKTTELSLEGLKQRAEEILRGNEGTMTETQFKEYIIDWLGFERLTDEFFDSWYQYDHDRQELIDLIKQYESKETIEML